MTSPERPQPDAEAPDTSLAQGTQTPQDLIDHLSNFDPATVATGAAGPASPTPGAPDESGPPPDDAAEQTRLQQNASEFQNGPDRSRDDHLTRIGRGHQTHG